MTNSHSKPKDLDEILKFVCGEGDLDGYWFNDIPDDRPKYWWRSELRKAIASQRTEAQMQLLDELESLGYRIGSFPLSAKSPYVEAKEDAQDVLKKFIANKRADLTNKRQELTETGDNKKRTRYGSKEVM